MNKLFSNLNISKICEIFKEVINRFPFAFLSSFIIFVLFLVLIGFDNSISQVFEKELIKVILTLITSFFFFVWLDLLLESSKISTLKKMFLKLIPFLFAWVFYYFLNIVNEFETVIYILLTTFWFISFIFIWWFLFDIFSNKYEENKYYNYFFKVSISFLFAFIFGGFLFSLWAIWILSVDALFDIDYNSYDKLYGYWAAFSLSFLAPTFLLYNIPKKELVSKNELYENKFFSFLVKYVFISFIYLYFVILYIYTVKVLINFQDWPKWEVSWMVIWFSIFGYLVYIFSYVFSENNFLIGIFRKYFPIIVFPQIFMLFYAIYLRISQYDLTINRYFIVVFGIWLLTLSLYYIFSKAKNLYFIPLTLSAFIFIISLWPWWVYNLPESRQYDRLISNLQKAWICINENSYWSWCSKIVPLNDYSDIEEDLSKNIYSWIDYVCDFNNCEKIKELFREEINKEEKKREEEFYRNINIQIKSVKSVWGDTSYYNDDKYDWMSSWEIVSFLGDYLKVSSYLPYDYEANSKYINISKNYNFSFYPINLSWYNYFVNIYSKDSSTSIETSYLKADIDNKKIDLFIDNNLVETFSLDDINKKIIDLKSTKAKNDEYLASELTFDLVWKKYDLKLFFNSFSLLNDKYKALEGESEKYNYSSVSWVWLVREK